MPLRCDILGIFSPFSARVEKERRCIFPFHLQAKKKKSYIRMCKSGPEACSCMKKDKPPKKGGDCRHLLKGVTNEEQMCDSPPPPPRAAIQAALTDQVSWQMQVNELNHPEFGPPTPSSLKTTDSLLSPLSSSAPPPNCSIPIQLGFLSPRCAFPSKDSTSFFYSLSSSFTLPPFLFFFPAREFFQVEVVPYV